MSNLTNGTVDANLESVQVRGDSFFFAKYCKHIPRILRHQLVSKLVNEYMYQASSDTSDSPFKANTSIYRFHGALLFVDISGFTVLSQKLKVDELKNQINAYFQKIVDIINRFEGQIIKFAGDALFVVWQTPINDTGDAGFLDAAKAAVDQAVACGRAINVECANYAISLKPAHRDDNSMTSTLLKSILNIKGSPLSRSNARLVGRPDRVRNIASGSTPSSGGPREKQRNKEAAVTYLNVHAGVSVGVMAGLDVGARDRFEYLLLGQPMSDVAVAEGDAGQGEVVVSPDAHLLLHGPTDFSSDYAAALDEVDPAHSFQLLLPCGCQRTPSGYFKLPSALQDRLCKTDFAPPPRDPAQSAADLMISVEEYLRIADLQFELEVNAQVSEELMAGYKAIRPAIEARFAGMEKASVDPNSPSDPPSKVVAEFAQSEVMTEHFMTWAQHCLLDGIARHVHEVVRRDFAFYAESRDAPLDRFLASTAWIVAAQRETDLPQRSDTDNNINTPHRSVLRKTIENTAITAKADPAIESAERVRESFVSKLRLQTSSLCNAWEIKKSRHDSLLNSDSSLHAEIRSVIVLFISVKTGAASIFEDPAHFSDCDQTDNAVREAAAGAAGIQTCKVDSFHFLRRTTAEIEADRRLVNMFQGCMEVTTEVFLAKGGQLRQFIVDDKGTVCIGTFGLRGSVNYDNAAAALEAADLIIARIQALGFDASVGVTSGAAYCGLVGSNTRHEYAVMGPSTNLSARLMSRAAPGEILCDGVFRKRDRAYAFTSLGAIKAKGYSKPVPIFKPEIETSKGNVQLGLVLPDHSEGVTEIDELAAEVFGRDQEARHILGFLFQDAVKGSLQTLWDTFWLPAVEESVDLLRDNMFVFSAVELVRKTTSSSNMQLPVLTLPERQGRFHIMQPTKEAVVEAVNGMGKTAFLNLMQVKLNRLIAKNPESYNLAVFRHQAGVVNTTTVFSGWFCLMRQTLFNIAAYLAATDDPLAAGRLDALRKNDCIPIVDFLTPFLPTELQPYVSLLSNVGISLARSPTSVAQIATLRHTGSENFSTEADDESISCFERRNLPGSLTLGDRLELSVRLVVAIAQLHVTITRKMTVYIMDDLHQHDELSKQVTKVLVRHAHGIFLLGSVRKDSPTTSPVAQPQSNAKVPITSKLVSPRCLHTELLPIDLATGTALLAKIFAESGVSGVDEAVLVKVHGLSGGNPMLIAGLSQIICDSYIHRDQQHAAESAASTSKQLLEIIDEMHADRIEEFVHFRFDKLSEQCQLVLKTAAVAGLNGAHFTLPMLAFVLDVSDYAEFIDEELSGCLQSELDERAGLAISSVELVQALCELLESDSFIECRESMAVEVAPRNRDCSSSLPLPSPKVPGLAPLIIQDHDHNTALLSLRFHWKVGMELRAIYDLMLDEQKESLHGRVACFLEHERRFDDEAPTATDWSELGFHWARATAWSAAMICYYRAAMLLHVQGGTEASKASFTKAYQMLEKMRLEAGVQSLAENHHPPSQQQCEIEGVRSPQCDWERVVALLSEESTNEENMTNLVNLSIDCILSGRREPLCVSDLHRMFEQSSEVLYIGLSVMVRLAQAMLLPEPTALAYYLFCNVLDMVYVVEYDTEALKDVDDGVFGLRQRDICFPIYSGVFLLMLNNYGGPIVQRIERMVAVVLCAVQLGRSSPEYEVHLLMALVNKRRLMERCLLQAPQLADQILACTEDIQRLYQRDKHSQDLIHFYNSDHVANGTSVAAKVLCLQGRFTEMRKYLDYGNQLSAKIKHFFSHAMGKLCAFTIYLCYLPDVLVQLTCKELQRKVQLANVDSFRKAVPLFAEGIAQYLNFIQYRATGEDNVFDSDSAFVEELLQSRQLVQDEQDSYHMHIARIYHSGLEFVAARICYLKALRFDLQYARDRNDKALSQVLAYVKLGLLHLTFTPTQQARNEALVFSNLHEKLLRTQLLLLLLKYNGGDCSAVQTTDGGSPSAGGSSIAGKDTWAAIRKDLTYCCEVAQRGQYHTILFQVGALMQVLGRSYSSKDQAGVSESEASCVCTEGAVVQDNALLALCACNVAAEDGWVGMFAAALVVPEEQLLRVA